MSSTLYALFVEPLTQSVFQRALLGGSLVAIVCAVVGCYIILQADGLSGRRAGACHVGRCHGRLSVYEAVL